LVTVYIPAFLQSRTLLIPALSFRTPHFSIPHSNHTFFGLGIKIVW
jgi:hypothetical protein